MNSIIVSNFLHITINFISQCIYFILSISGLITLFQLPSRINLGVDVQSSWCTKVIHYYVYKRSAKSYLGFSSNDMQINSILNITEAEKFQTKSEFKVIVLINVMQCTMLRIHMYMMIFHRPRNKLKRFSNSKNVSHRVYNNTLSEILMTLQWKVKTCNLIKRHWWLHG